MEQFTFYTKIIRKQIKVALGDLSSLADEEAIVDRQHQNMLKKKKKNHA